MGSFCSLPPLEQHITIPVTISGWQPLFGKAIGDLHCLLSASSHKGMRTTHRLRIRAQVGVPSLPR